MDRIVGKEETEWAQGPFNDGSQARIDGFSQQHCPDESKVGQFAAQSWRAGWADAEQDITVDGLSEQMPVTR